MLLCFSSSILGFTTDDFKNNSLQNTLLIIHFKCHYLSSIQHFLVILFLLIYLCTSFIFHGLLTIINLPSFLSFLSPLPSSLLPSFPSLLYFLFARCDQTIGDFRLFAIVSYIICYGFFISII